MSEKFGFEAALKAIQSGQAITGKDGVLAPLVKQLTEAVASPRFLVHSACQRFRLLISIGLSPSL